jgi:hypothetical protein
MTTTTIPQRAGVEQIMGRLADADPVLEVVR